MSVVMKQKKRPRIMPYAFEANLEYTSRDSVDDVIPVIMCWIFENIGPYDKKRWQI